MGMTALFVDGVAHHLAVYGEAFNCACINLVPALLAPVAMVWIDADEDIGYCTRSEQGLPLLVTASEALARLGEEAFGPIRDSPAPEHPTQRCPSGNGQNGRESVTPPLGATAILLFRKDHSVIQQVFRGTKR